MACLLLIVKAWNWTEASITHPPLMTLSPGQVKFLSHGAALGLRRTRLHMSMKRRVEDEQVQDERLREFDCVRSISRPLSKSSTGAIAHSARFGPSPRHEGWKPFLADSMEEGHILSCAAPVKPPAPQWRRPRQPVLSNVESTLVCIQAASCR